MSKEDRAMPPVPRPPSADAERSEDPSTEQDTIFDAMIAAYLKPSPEVVARYDEIGKQTCVALAKRKSRSGDGSEESVAMPVRNA